MKLRKYCSKIIALGLCLCSVSSSLIVHADSLDNSSSSTYQSIDSSVLNLNEVIDEIKMSPNDVERYYNEFASKNTKSLQYENGYDDIQDFVNYAVSEGLIEDNEASRTVMSKEAYRVQFRAAGNTLKNFGLYYAGEFMINSLNDKPATKSYAASSNLAADIKLQSGYTNTKTTIKNAISKLPSSSTSYSESDGFYMKKNGTNKKSWDMFLALHGVSYTAKATKNTSTKKWSYTMTITDRYDFKKEDYQDSPIVNTVNNYAVGAQKAGAIVPFNIKVLVNDTI